MSYLEKIAGTIKEAGWLSRTGRWLKSAATAEDVRNMARTVKDYEARPYLHIPMFEGDAARLIEKNQKIIDKISMGRINTRKKRLIDAARDPIEEIKNLPEGGLDQATRDKNYSILEDAFRRGRKGAIKTGLVYGAPITAGYGGYRYIKNKRNR